MVTVAVHAAEQLKVAVHSVRLIPVLLTQMLLHVKNTTRWF